MTLRHIAVIDVGKTNAKLALVNAGTLNEIAVVTRPNTVRPGPPYPHFDLEGHWAFFRDGLAAFHRDHGIDAISVTTHGAAAVLLDAGRNLAAPMLDYEHELPDSGYDALRPPFAETGSPRLPCGLNLGAQLHWLLRDPEVAARTAHVLTYPQYWAWRLTGVMATDVTSLGCHTDLWNPWEGRFSSLVDRLGLTGKLAPARRSSDTLGLVRDGLGLPCVPVACGIHDSNASLLPHVLGRTGAFSVVSTGTWVVAMAVDGAKVDLDPTQDVLVNVNALGRPVPSARFMGGREYEVVRNGGDPATTSADSATVLRDGTVMLSPQEWTRQPATQGQRMVALGHYLALMTKTCLDRIGARGPAIVEGPFARNRDYLSMLAAVHGEVEIATSATGTSIGAALLFADRTTPPATRPVAVDNAPALRDHAARWHRRKDTACA
ncbi:FGGY-family carbohydrate kinase [Falsirhodobacter sp. 1013]|uniref:FGGY-family carbohydrate kinase n=1 Tax=Falsirhodobacter sp. 1013 TaxID=3417566 RepID=UPI003EBFD463